MPQCVVIADDLTGANATGALLRNLNLRTASLIDAYGIDFDTLSGYDVVTCPTESRYIDEGQAYKRVYEAAALFKGHGVILFNKRIDSTLRGNLGAEIDGILDGLGDDKTAMVVPSFPQAGRIALGGYLLVNGKALHHTDVAKDPKIPITTSNIATLIQKQTKYTVASIPFDIVSKGAAIIEAKIKHLSDFGVRVIIFDAVEEEDIDTIADAVINAKKPFVSVDPAPFTGSLAKKVLTPKTAAADKKILIVLGSVTDVAKLQLEETFLHLKGRIIEVDAGALILPDCARQELTKAMAVYEAEKNDYDLWCITTQSFRRDAMLNLRELSRSLNLTVEEISLRISEGLAQISRAVIASGDIQGIFSSGGDTTAALYRSLGAGGIELKRELEALVAYGTLLGGERQGLRVVTKGGMAGNKDSIKNAIQFLKEQIQP